MAAVAQIDIVINDKDLTAGMQRVQKQVGGLEPAFQKAGQSSNVVFTRMVKDQEKARDAASLLGRTMGVELPRQLDKFLAKSTVLGPALASAFNVAVIAGFALAIVDLIGKIPALIEKIYDWTGSVKANYEAQKTLNSALLDQEKQVRSLNEQYKLIGLEGSRQVAQSQRNIADEIARVTAELNSAVQSSEALRKQSEKATGPFSLFSFEGISKALTGEDVKRMTELQDRILLLGAQLRVLNAEARNTGKEFAVAFSNERTDQTIKQAEATREMEGHVAQLTADYTGAGVAADFAAKNIARVNGELAKQPEFDAQTRAARFAAIEEIARIERESAVAILPPWQRADAEILLSAQERTRQIQLTSTEFERQQGLTAARIGQVWVQTFAQMRDRLADSLEGLFDDITSGNIGRRFLDNFKRLIFQMIAQWILGVNQMRAASAGGFGGGAGSILGAIFTGLLGIPNIFGASAKGASGTSVAAAVGAGFGGPLGLGAGVSSLPLGPGTPAAASVLSSLLGGGLSAGGGLGLGSALPAGASLGVSLKNILPGLGPLIALGGFNLIGALASGPGTGAAIGAALGALALGGLVAGPIGAIIGAIFGFFLGGKKKRQRDRLTNELAQQIKKVKDAYSFHQIDFDSTIAQLEQFRGQYAQAIHKLGGDTRARVHRPIDQAEAEIRAIEDERQRRQSVVFGPAEFHRGGFVAGPGRVVTAGFAARAMKFQGGGAVPAVLHAGEFVLRPEAVQRIGRGALERANAGGGFGGQIHFHIQAIDAKSFEGWLSAGGGKAVLEFLRRVEAEGWA